MKYYIALTALAVMVAGGCSSRARWQGGEFETVGARESETGTGRAVVPSPGKAQIAPAAPEGSAHEVAPADSDNDPDVFLPRKRYETLHI